MNPYWNCDLFSFIHVFFIRLLAFLSGDISLNHLASDELQIGVLCCIGISAAVIGPFLVLKKMTMFANALSHTSLLGIALSFLLIPSQGSFSLLIFISAALLTAIVTGGFTDLLKRVFKVHEEASTGLVFTFLFAIGVVLVTVFLKNAHLGAEAIMGNIDAIHLNDITKSAWLAASNLAVILLFFPYYKICAFDEILARSQGCYPSIFSKLLILQTAFTTISSFRAVGVFLFLIFLTAPVLAARLLSHRLKYVISISAALSLLCSFLGVAFSRHSLTVYDIPLSTGALSATCVALCYPVVYCLMHLKKYISVHYIKKHHRSL